MIILCKNKYNLTQLIENAKIIVWCWLKAKLKILIMCWTNGVIIIEYVSEELEVTV
jgi:hypothetical protein